MFNEMKYVYAVYQHRSFSKAAKQLFVTQPTLSAMIRKVEESIGCPIFDRSTVPITVTKEGEFYIHSIEQIIAIQKSMTDYFQDIADLKSGVLSIGGSSYFCSYFLGEIIGQFKRRYPGIQINLQEGNIAQLKEGLQSSALDLILETALNEEDTNIQKFFLGTEHIILCVPASFSVNDRLKDYRLSFDDVRSQHYLEDAVPAVPLGELRDVPFLIMKKGNDMYQRSIGMCKRAGFTPKIAMQLDQLLTAFFIASSGAGAVFMRAELCRYLPSTDNMAFYKLNDQLATRPVYIACKKGRYISRAMRVFLEVAGAELER